MCLTFSLQRFNIHHQQNSTSREYYTDLQKQAETRHRQLQQLKDDEKQLELQHADKASKVWGGGHRPPNPFRTSWERREAAKVRERAARPAPNMTYLGNSLVVSFWDRIGSYGSMLCNQSIMLYATTV